MIQELRKISANGIQVPSGLANIWKLRSMISATTNTSIRITTAEKTNAVLTGDLECDVLERTIETTLKITGAAKAWIAKARESVVAAIANPIDAPQRAQPAMP